MPPLSARGVGDNDGPDAVVNQQLPNLNGSVAHQLTGLLLGGQKALWLVGAVADLIPIESHNEPPVNAFWTKSTFFFGKARLSANPR